jgi:ribose/xylose/arabinose/galactoside ABC-type transport system permease subunit
MSSEVKEEMRASPGWRFSLYIKLSRTSLYWLNRALPIFCGLVVLVYLYFHAPSFYRINNLLNILVQTSSLEVTAIGNGERVAEQLGIPVRRVTFLSFILSALVASLGGLASLLQVGSLSGYLGKGLEFTAVAVVVVGGVSLFGGRGSFLPGVVAGAAIFEMIENGLNQIGANPYVYRLVTGAVIFIAMYADALSRGALHERSFSRRKQNISPGTGGSSPFTDN